MNYEEGVARLLTASFFLLGIFCTFVLIVDWEHVLYAFKWDRGRDFILAIALSVGAFVGILRPGRSDRIVTSSIFWIVAGFQSPSGGK